MIVDVIMRMVVGVRMRMPDGAVAVPVRVNKVNAEQEGRVAENLFGGTIRDEPVRFIENQRAIRDVRHDCQVVGGSDQGLAGRVQLPQERDEPVL